MKKINITVLSFLLLTISVSNVFSQDGLVKTIADYKSDIGQHTYMNGKLIFTEVQNSKNLWSYDLDSKEYQLVTGNLGFYGSGVFPFDDKVLFNLSGYISVYNSTSNEIQTISREDQKFNSTDLSNAIFINDEIYFSANEILWKFNKTSNDLDSIGDFGRIIGNGTRYIYFKKNYLSLNVYDIESNENKNIIDANIYFQLIRQEVIGEDLIFLHYSSGSSNDAFLYKYDALQDTLIHFDIPVKHYNSIQPYTFLKTKNANKLVFYDGVENRFWIYEEGTDFVREKGLEDQNGFSLTARGRFIEDDNKIFFGGLHSQYQNSLLSFNLESEIFDHIASFPSGYKTAEMGYTQPHFELRMANGEIIAQLYKSNVSERFIVSIDPIKKELDTIRELPFNNGKYEIFQNSIIYDEPQKSAGPHILWKYDLLTKKLDTIQGSYVIDAETYTWAKLLTQYDDKYLFLWDNRNRLLTIDDSYRDSTLVTESCDYYDFNGNIIEESGEYRKKIKSTPIDVVINLNLTINTLKSGTTKSTSYLQANEEDADSYQWFRCEDLMMLSEENGRKLYYENEDYYGVILKKGSCIDTTGCPYFKEITAIACRSFEFQHNTYYESGNYEYYLYSYPTDTLFEISLEIDELDLEIVKIEDDDPTILHLVANQADAEWYQWIDCESGTPIEGENKFSLLTKDEGSFGLVLSKGSCLDTTLCFSNIHPTILGDEKRRKLVEIFPNPTSSMINIEGFNTKNTSINLYDLSGNLIQFNTTVTTDKFTTIIIPSKGLYILHLKSNSIDEYHKILVE